jgi:hypothetical protein
MGGFEAEKLRLVWEGRYDGFEGLAAFELASLDATEAYDDCCHRRNSVELPYCEEL